VKRKYREAREQRRLASLGPDANSDKYGDPVGHSMVYRLDEQVDKVQEVEAFRRQMLKDGRDFSDREATELLSH
jgi:hypothetical protein